MLEINEEWIKNRVNIRNEKLDDIKALLLPGTYEEKINSLGSALLHFSRLKELDISRNLLESLQGLEHLQCLENLNVYYNNVSSLKELYRLKSNQKIRNLDFRLNPVTRTENDYRSCLIFMLPRLEILDGRDVHSEEKKAALMYFGSDQLTYDPNEPHKPKTMSLVKSGSSNPRVDMVNRWTRGVIKNKDRQSIRKVTNEEKTPNEDAKKFNLISRRSIREYSTKERLDVERDLKNSKNDQLSKYDKDIPGVPIFKKEPSMIPESTKRSDSSSSMSAVGNMGDVHSTDLLNKICVLIESNLNQYGTFRKNPDFITTLAKLISSEYGCTKKEKTEQLSSRISYLENENQQLKDKIYKIESQCEKPVANDHEDIIRTNEMLKSHINDLRKRIDASEQLSELTHLLKQSHESLLITNEELRRQLSRRKPLSKRHY